MSKVQSLNTALSVATMTPLPRTDSVLRPSGKQPASDAKIDKAAKDFESILLGDWLQHAEDTVAKVPGTDEEESEDDGTAQMQQGLAIRPLADALTASCGIGIAGMIVAQLRKGQPNEPTDVPNSVRLG